jgi:hypothetical protein
MIRTQLLCLETAASIALRISMNPTTSNAAIVPPMTAPSVETAIVEGGSHISHNASKKWLYSPDSMADDDL